MPVPPYINIETNPKSNIIGTWKVTVSRPTGGISDPNKEYYPEKEQIINVVDMDPFIRVELYRGEDLLSSTNFFPVVPGVYVAIKKVLTEVFMEYCYVDNANENKMVHILVWPGGNMSDESGLGGRWECEKVN